MATQEQDDFADAFGEDVQRSEMSEDEAFGLAPEADPETPDESEAEMAEEAEESAAEPAIAESAPNDPAPAETGEAGPAEETAVVVEPGAEDAGDVEVMSPEDIQREKSWMGRLKAKEAELKAREEAMAELTRTAERQAASLTEAGAIAAQKQSEIERLTTSLAARSNRSDSEPESVAALRAELEAVRARARDQANQIDRLQRLALEQNLLLGVACAGEINLVAHACGRPVDVEREAASEAQVGATREREGVTLEVVQVVEPVE